jgi:hypothetical protein
MKFKANEIYLKQAKKSKMWCPYITKKFNYKNIVRVITIFGGLSVFSPYKTFLYWHERLMKTPKVLS